MKFSTTSARQLTMPAGKRDHIEWDPELPGFGLRLRGDTRRWVVQYRVGRQQRREGLGDVRKVGLEDARKAARQRFAQIELGVDPAAAKAKARAAADAARLTLAVVSERYLDAKEGVVRPATLRAAKWHFEGLWKPLRKRPIEAIRRADVAARLAEIAKANGRVSAARARTALSALYGWAMREGLCEANPVVATNDPGEGIPSRGRVLSDPELRAVWHACQDDDFGRIVRLLILTGCRRTEIGSLRWSEIDLDTGVLIIPGARRKNHKPLELTLPSAAIGILRSVQQRFGSDCVFGQRGTGFGSWSYGTRALQLRIAEAEGRPLAPFVLHDMRRTTRTGLGRLGVRPDVAELVIGHAKGGVEAIYDVHKYESEIAAALAVWSDHVTAVVDGGERNMKGAKNRVMTLRA
jgi:integrase